MGTWFAETWYLAKTLFSKMPKDNEHLEVVQMKFYPWPGYGAMSWAGKLITREDPKNISEWTKKHEEIHLQQAHMMGKTWFSFYLKYLGEYLANLFFTWTGFSGSYYLISVEKQAYGNQARSEYKVTKENLRKYRTPLFLRHDEWIKNKNNWRAHCESIEK